MSFDFAAIYRSNREQLTVRHFSFFTPRETPLVEADPSVDYESTG